MGEKFYIIDSKKKTNTLFRTKYLSNISLSSNKFEASLDLSQLLLLGLGGIIGAGIFIYTGEVASNNTGPAIVISIIISGMVAAFSALSYCELASMIPLTGSVYTYCYFSMGEIIAWIIGWDFILEGIIGTSTIAIGWSSYFLNFFTNLFGTSLPPSISNPALLWSEKTNSFSLSGSYINLPAILIIIILSIILIIGTKEMANLNTLIVIIKILVIIVFIGSTFKFIDTDLWFPLIPSNSDGKFGHFGISGILKGSSILFFAYLGFDSISIASQEAKNPQRDMPIAIIGSLFISTFIYIGISLVLVGLIPYKELGVPNPISLAVEKTQMTWLVSIVDLGIICGLSSVIMISLMSSARIIYIMSEDGLLPLICSQLHKKYKTPYVNQIVLLISCSLIAGIFPINFLSQLSTIGSLLSLVLTNISVIVLRKKRKDIERKFKVPLGPYFIPVLGALSSICLIFFSSLASILRLFIWFLLGLIVYSFYGRHYSKLNLLNI